jgi:hypothetical protein
VKEQHLNATKEYPQLNDRKEDPVNLEENLEENLESKEKHSDPDNELGQFNNSYKDFYANIEEHPKEILEEFFQWVQVQYPELVAQVKEGRTISEDTHSKVIPFLIDLFRVRPDELYGRAHVTSELQEDSKRTALAITIADGWHFVTTLPLLMIAFKDLFLVGGILALVTGVGLLKFSNICGAIAAAAQPNKKSWSHAGVGGMILTNLVLALFAGPGTELAMNQPELSAKKAQEIVKEKIRSYQIKIDSAQENLKKAQGEKSECEVKTAQFTELKKDREPRADSLYREINGAWGVDENHWKNVPTDQLPICKKAPRRENEATEAKQDMENIRKRSQADGGELIFLKKEYPETYKKYFTDDENIKSGVDLVKLATESFFGKCSKLEFFSLGLSMVSFVISVMTSGTAVALVIAHSQRPDVAMSFDQKIIDERNKFFAAIQKAINKANSQDIK